MVCRHSHFPVCVRDLRFLQNECSSDSSRGLNVTHMHSQRQYESTWKRFRLRPLTPDLGSENVPVTNRLFQSALFFRFSSRFSFAIRPPRPKTTTGHNKDEQNHLSYQKENSSATLVVYLLHYLFVCPWISSYRICFGPFNLVLVWDQITASVLNQKRR